jgi:hypothetical protein
MYSVPVAVPGSRSVVVHAYQLNKTPPSPPAPNRNMIIVIFLSADGFDGTRRH